MHRNPRTTSERDASQAMFGNDRAEGDDEELEQPERVPSFLTARELQARDPAKPSPADGSAMADDDDDEDEAPKKGGRKGQ